MPEAFAIRPATLEDLPALMPLWRAAQEIQSDFRPMRIVDDPDARFAEGFRASLGSGETWLVAHARGAVIAMAYLHEEKPSGMSDEHVLEISRVSVAAEWRGRGVGRALVERAEHEAAHRGLRFLSARIFTRNEGAMKFWRQIGFEDFVTTSLKSLDRLGD